ncbi:MAG: carboxypeptidase regulatory-like domain-containing protein, partial [Bryobacteraceae bacterium]
ISAHTGLPINITSGVDNSKTGVGLDRPNQMLLDAYNSNWGPSLPQYLNGAAFVQNAVGTFGNVGRDSVFGPGTFEFDAALSRIFAIGERWRLEVRAEGFNVINHTNFNAPTGNLSSTQFGQINSAASNRILQFALKLHF